ncbi:TPA: O-antigen ligase family protein, partial [Vibrio metschnikovii]
FFLVVFTVRWDINKLESFRRFFLISCLIIILFGYFEALTSIGNTIALNLYKPNRAVLEGKAVGSFIITYAFATFLVFPFYVFLSRYFFSKTLINKYLFLSFLTLGCMFLTQSKTVFLAVIISLVLFFFIYPLYSGLPGRRKVLLFGVGTIFSVMMSFAFLLSFFESYFSYIYSGLEVVTRFLLDEGVMAALNSNTSTRNRLEQLVFAIEHQDFLPLIGVGIGKGTFMPESFYALYLYRVGLIGILLHVALLLYSLKLSLDNVKILINYERLNLSSLFLGLHFYIISLPFCYFSAAVNDQTRTGFFLYLFIAINIATNKFLKSRV